MLQITLYSREQGGIKVEAIQKLVEGKYVYEVAGFVNGELVRTEPTKGFREAAPSGRKMFKELFEAHGEHVAKVQKSKMTPEEKAVMLEEKMAAKITRQAELQEKKIAERELKKIEAAAKRAEARAEAAAKVAEGAETPAKGKKGKKVYSVAAGAVVNDPN